MEEIHAGFTAGDEGAIKFVYAVVFRYTKAVELLATERFIVHVAVVISKRINLLSRSIKF